MSGRPFLDKLNGEMKAFEELTGHHVHEKTFCILPFTHLSTTTVGEIRLCCRSKPIGNIKKSSLEEVWSSDKLNKIRDSLIKGERVQECQKCWDAEDKDIVSLRQGQNMARLMPYQRFVDNYIQGLEVKLPTIELKLSNRCNLQCQMCSPAASTKWLKKWPQVMNLYDEGYQNWVNKIIDQNELTSAPNLDLYFNNDQFVDDFTNNVGAMNLLDFAGGEPLIDPLHYKVLNAVIEHGRPEETTLRYSTNLTILSFEKFHVLDLWSRFKEVHLTISVDGHRELNEYIRLGTKSEEFEKNVKAIKQIDKVTSLKCTTTLSAHNALFIAETIDYIIGTLEIGWHSSRVTSPDFLDARIWDKEHKEKAIEKVLALDLDQYNLSEPKLIQAKRHVSDYVSWMRSDLENREQLMNSFLEFTRRSDKKTHLNYQSFLDQF